MCPAYFSDQDLKERRKYQVEFSGFNASYSMIKILEVLTMHNPKNAYQQSDTKVIVEYEQEADLFNACEHAVYFNSYKIIGTPRGYPCWIYNKKLLVKPPVEIPQHRTCNAKPTPSQDIKTHSIVAQKQDEHFNAPPVTLKDLTPTSLTQPSDQ